MTDHNPGANGPAEQGGAGRTGAKVVPFPRSWYGSVDELVPIAPSPPKEPDRSVASPDASTFWGGNAAEPSGRDSNAHDDWNESAPDRERSYHVEVPSDSGVGAGCAGEAEAAREPSARR